MIKIIIFFLKSLFRKGKQYTYKFVCGICAWQEELNAEEDFKVTEILMSCKLDKIFNEKTNALQVPIIQIFKTLKDSNVLGQFLLLILKPISGTYNENDLLKLKNSELEKVFTDFFLLNPSVKKLWKRIVPNQDGMISKLTSYFSNGTVKSTTPAS
jgi:hypothetical protein